MSKCGIQLQNKLSTLFFHKNWLKGWLIWSKAPRNCMYLSKKKIHNIVSCINTAHNITTKYRKCSSVTQAFPILQYHTGTCCNPMSVHPIQFQLIRRYRIYIAQSLQANDSLEIYLNSHGLTHTQIMTADDSDDLWLRKVGMSEYWTCGK